MILRSWIRTVAVPAILVAILNTAHGADEDMNASVYLTFDPETGEFITQQQDSSGNPVPSTHAQSPSPSQPAPGAQQQNPPAQAAAAKPAAQSGGTGGEAVAGNTGIWLGGLAVLGLLAGVGLWIRKGQQKVPT